MAGKNADLTFKADRTEITALHLAARNNHVNLVNFLLDQKVELEAKSAEIFRTPLHFAAEADSLEAVIVLVQFGADPNFLDVNDSTPLHCAAEYGAAKVVEYLVSDAKADPSLVNKQGQTPLKLTQSIEVCKLLGGDPKQMKTVGSKNLSKGRT